MGNTYLRDLFEKRLRVQTQGRFRRRFIRVVFQRQLSVLLFYLASRRGSGNPEHGVVVLARLTRKCQSLVTCIT